MLQPGPSIGPGFFYDGDTISIIFFECDTIAVMDLNEISRQVIAHNRYLVIATATIDGAPWISPVFFAPDETYNLYWTSNKDARHSELIRSNPRVMIVIYDKAGANDEVRAVYLECDAKELQEEDEIRHGMQVMHTRPQADRYTVHDIADAQGDKQWRIYRATPQKVYALSPEDEIIGGQSIDTKVEVQL